MIFEYPYASPSVTLTLRDPELGDSLEHNTQVRHAQDMGGGVHTFKYTPATRRYLWTFKSIMMSKAQEVKDFMNQSAGREIKVTLYDSTILRGRVSNINPFELAAVRNIPGSNGSSDACVEAYDFTIEFEGDVA